MSFKIRLHSLPFLVGSFSEVSAEIILGAKTHKSQVILPCDLSSLAHRQSLAYSYRSIDICTTDGMPLVWLTRLKTRQKIERVYGPDLMLALCRNQDLQQLRHVFFGSANPQNLTKLLSKIHRLSPKLKIVGAISPPMHHLSRLQTQKYLSKIHAKKPDLVWIGLSSPLQIQIAAKLKKLLPDATILCVGAAFDFLALIKPSAPNWMKKAGLEWLFRLLTEPKRLWKRYLVTIPKFLFLHGFELLFQ